MFTAIRRVRIMAGELGLLSGAHVRCPVPRHVRLHVLLLVQPAAVAGAAAEAAADAGEV